MEECLAETAAGKQRKLREEERKEAELTRELEKEDERIEKEKQILSEQQPQAEPSEVADFGGPVDIWMDEIASDLHDKPPRESSVVNDGQYVGAHHGMDGASSNAGDSVDSERSGINVDDDEMEQRPSTRVAPHSNPGLPDRRHHKVQRNESMMSVTQVLSSFDSTDEKIISSVLMGVSIAGVPGFVPCLHWTVMRNNACSNGVNPFILIQPRCDCIPSQPKAKAKAMDPKKI